MVTLFLFPIPSLLVKRLHLVLRPLQISADFETALLEVCAYLPDFCVPDERDLRFASTGSNFNPPEADKSSKYSMYSCG